jgi:hypothetical protein
MRGGGRAAEGHASKRVEALVLLELGALLRPLVVHADELCVEPHVDPAQQQHRLAQRGGAGGGGGEVALASGGEVVQVGAVEEEEEVQVEVEGW